VSQELIRQSQYFYNNYREAIVKEIVKVIEKAKLSLANIFILFERPYCWLLSRI